MKVLLWLLLILLGALTLSIALSDNVGYVLLVQHPYRIELSLNLFVGLMLLGFVMLYGTLRFVQYILRLPHNVRRYKLEQQRKRAHAALLKSLHSLAEGHYDKAERRAARTLKLGEDAALSALVAARAAHEQGRQEKRDHYLAEAERLAPQATLARLFLQAQLLVDDRNYAQALAILHQIEKLEPQHLPALKLQLRVQQKLGNWGEVVKLASTLEKRSSMDGEMLRQARLYAYRQLLEQCAGKSEELLACWKKIPESDQLQTSLALLAAHLFNAAGEGAAATRVVEMSLARQWDSELAALYGDCQGADLRHQLQRAEAWLERYPQDASLLLALGKLCLRQKLWGKAQNYLEASLGIKPSAAGYLALAKLHESSGRLEEARKHYLQGLECTLATHKAVPGTYQG